MEKMASKEDAIFNCVFSGDLDHLKQLLEVAVDVSVESPEQDLFVAVDESGRNALLAASLLGNTSIVRELVTHGARVNEQTVRGYSSLHLAACWGRLETVQTLLELGANTQARTFRGETPGDLARKYSHTDCAECLTVAETTKEEAINESQKDQTEQEKVKTKHKLNQTGTNQSKPPQNLTSHSRRRQRK